MAHLACVHGLIDYLRVLREYKANLDLATLEGIRPAHEAVVNLQIECLRYLIVHVHCPVNTKSGNGASLLHYAADKGSVEMCHFLVENGAELNSVLSHEDTNSANYVYYTPVDFARMKGQEECVSYLESVGGKSGEDVADKATRKIQKLLRRRVAESRRQGEQAGTGTDTEQASQSESGLTKEGDNIMMTDIDTTDEEGSRSVLSPFHVPTPLRERKYYSGLQTLSLATPPLKFPSAPQPSPLPMPVISTSPIALSPEDQINAMLVQFLVCTMYIVFRDFIYVVF